MWATYLDAPYRERAPRVVRPRSAGGSPLDVTESARRHVLAAQLGISVARLSAKLDGDRVGLRWLEVEGKPVSRGVSDAVWKRGRAHTREHYGLAVARGFDAASVVDTLADQGINRAQLFPTAGLLLFAIDTMAADLAAALVRAYNLWLGDFCSYNPAFLRPVGAVCRHDPVAMVYEAAELAKRGWKTLTVRPNPIGGRSLGHPDYEPFWALCEELELGVAVHEGAHALCPTVGQDRFETRFAQLAASHPMEQMLGFLSLLEGGVLARHPRLRVAFMEAGAGWLPFWLGRLDRGFHDGYSDATRERMDAPPSEIFKRQCWVTVEPGEPGLAAVVDTVGADRLLYGTDFPHIDHALDVKRDLASLSDVAPTGLTEQLNANANAFFKTS